MILISIFDKIAKRFSPPTIISNEQAGARLFKREMNKFENISRKGDFALYNMGQWDEEEGIRSPQEDLKPILILEGDDVETSETEAIMQERYREFMSKNGGTYNGQ